MGFSFSSKKETTKNGVTKTTTRSYESGKGFSSSKSVKPADKKKK